ncbi:MAG: hypothetical protein KIT09_23270 [Bryobacteraceae bacterium]|nr:hypothetical protein [Bryobacteraceae bacterium]
MLRSTKEIIGYKLAAVDGAIGSVDDLAFDDRTWEIRYIVGDTGGWLSGRQVLLSPASFGQPDWSNQTIPVSLNKRQIENSPGIDTDKTVSRKYETELHRYYGWPAYWVTPPPGEMAYIPTPAPTYVAVADEPGVVERDNEQPEDHDAQTHLRGVKEVTGYNIGAIDGDIGHVEEFIVDDDRWAIRYMVIDTRNWLPGRKVLVSPLWIASIRWDERSVYVDLTREAVRNSPEYNPSQPVNRDYEVRLYDFYGRPKYW